MMMAIAKPLGTLTRGFLLFKAKPDSEVYVSQPRVKRTATLDGGAVIDHQGYAIGDRTIDIRAELSESESSDLWSIYKESTFLLLHTRDGGFYGAISDLRIDRGQMRLTFLVKEAA